ncbi:ABC transporter permease [Pseudodesulfovibrio sp. JC047]|uniref:ABC transporter permease n=1 Tax=Pseudodesulfovibrio sp. JC047 TaxID=2683199 RepID=UPI0013D2728C|nr:ABC transporter permease [Pseudodesulfovibrio sp. JC047]NDV18261.1 ABC transporter permease [Pseudodesulfovibrio sp. JC047]
MQVFSISPFEMVASPWRNRSLVLELSKRDILARYKGTLVGALWTFVNPLLMLAVYSFVFGFVFKTSWRGGTGNGGEFPLVLFSGLIVFNVFSECISRGPTLILSHISYVKKVIFPLEILPLVTLLSSLFHAVISFIVWLVAYFFILGVPDIHILLTPLLITPFLMVVMGVSWLLASLGVYLRDISQAVGVIVTVVMFMSPLFYALKDIPEPFRSYLYINPLTFIIEEMRKVLFLGQLPDMYLLGGYSGVALLTMWLGFGWFQKSRGGFADVL